MLITSKIKTRVTDNSFLLQCLNL